jgi:hypothetical protein
MTILQKKTPWWLHFAKIGHSVGAGVAIGASVGSFIPYPPLQVAIGFLSFAGGLITHYADKGISSIK